MPLSPTEAGAASVLSRFSCFGAVTMNRLRRLAGSFSAGFSADRQVLIAAGLTEKEADDFVARRDPRRIEHDAEWLRREGIRTITAEDREFPELLRQLPDAPAFLHVRGALTADAAAVSVVGTRRATAYGLEMTRDLAAGLARAGLIVVSGLALGIDAAAHEAALAVGGVSWAFLPSGLNAASIYPPANRRLAASLLERGGALLSEFPPGVAGFKHIFPVRNRLIAGVALGTVVVEATEHSGSLLTAAAALAYNREVFAVPADARRPTAAGPHALLRRGATLVASADDVLTALGFSPTERAPTSPLTESESRLLGLLSREPNHINDLSRAIGQPISETARLLSLLELSGRARPSGGGWVRIG